MGLNPDMYLSLIGSDPRMILFQFFSIFFLLETETSSAYVNAEITDSPGFLLQKQVFCFLNKIST